MNEPYPKKSMGQHWLRDESILLAICQAGDVQPGDTVLEVGPGLGTLTKVLAKNCKQVIAVEFDERLAADLQSSLQLPNVTVQQGDIRTYDFSRLPAGYKVVANIPYYLTSHLIRILSETPNQAIRVALLIQKEVAERVAARPGGMSLLSATTQLFWDVRLDIVVPALAFEPPPKVDSQVLVLQRPNKPLYDNTDAILRVMKAGFSAPRKKLVNNLAAGFRIDKQVTRQAVETAGLEAGARAQDLTIDHWAELAKLLK